jgi:opacity protein-like surface antigen
VSAGRGALCLALALVLVAAPAAAQTPAPRVEIAAGALWIGAIDFGAVDANESTSGGGAFRLFASRSSLGRELALEGRFAVRLTDRLQVEGIGSYGRPRLITRVSLDAENAPALDVDEDTVRIAIEGAIVVSAARWRVGSRGVPFVTAGGGYLRQLHEGRTVVRTGQSYFAGAGIRYALAARMQSLVKTIGVRADGRLVVRAGGIALDDRVHLAPAVAASLYFGL